MDAAETIRNCIADVTALRLLRQSDPALAQAVLEVKQLQSRRFMGTYADLMADPMVEPATRFFLDELYSPGDFTARDDQFGRIAGARCRRCSPSPSCRPPSRWACCTPRPSSSTRPWASVWLTLGGTPDAARYVTAWRAVGERHARHEQLDSVLTIGKDLTRLTRMPACAPCCA